MGQSNCGYCGSGYQTQDSEANDYQRYCFPRCERKANAKKRTKKEIQRSMATEVAMSDTLDIDSETGVWS